MRMQAYVNVRMPSEVHAAVVAEAARRGVRVSRVIREAVRDAVAAEPRKETN